MLKQINTIFLMFVSIQVFHPIFADNLALQSISSVNANYSSFDAFYAERPFTVGLVAVGGLFATGYGVKKAYDYLKVRKALRNAAEKERKKKEFKEQLEDEAKKKKFKKFFDEHPKEKRFILPGHEYPQNYSSFFATRSEWAKQESAALAAEYVKLEWAQDQKCIKSLEETTKWSYGQISSLRELYKIVKSELRLVIFPKEHDITSDQISTCKMLSYKLNLYKKFDENYKQCGLLQHSFCELEQGIKGFESDLFKQHKRGAPEGQAYVDGYDERLSEKAMKVKELRQGVEQLDQKTQECLAVGKEFYSQSLKKVDCVCAYCRRLECK